MDKKRNYGVMYGVVAGLVLVVFFLVLYLIGVEAFMSPASFLSYVVIITIAVLAGIRQRKENGGFLSFREALKVTFTVFVIGFLLQTIFSYILFNFIDVPFREALTQRSMESAESMMRSFGATNEQIDKALDEASKRDNYSITNILLGYGMVLIVFFIVSLIIAAIIKRKQPEFDQSFNQGA